MGESYKQTELYNLMEERMPPLAKIKSCLEAIEPRIVSDMLISEPEIVFLLDYYFRLFQPELAARFINSEDFDLVAAVELYDCQVIRFYRANIDSTDHDSEYSSIMDSYWSSVSSNRLLEIFKAILSHGKSINPSALLLLQKLDVDSLEKVQEIENFQSKGMLQLFKNLGTGVLDIISNNLDLFDFLFQLSAEHGDTDYIKFLEEYTRFVVQLRIAQNMVEDGGNLVAEGGKIPLKDLIELIETIPDEALELTLQLLLHRNYIDEKTITSLQQMRKRTGKDAD